MRSCALMGAGGGLRLDAILAVSSFEFGTGAGFCGRCVRHGIYGEVGLRCVAGGFILDSGRRGCRG
jgi:hypothetical protein